MVFNKLFGKFKKAEVEDEEEIKVQDYLDMIAPSTIRFYTEYFICGNSYRSVWALREYPTSTDEQALLRYMGEKDGITLHIYARQVTSAEEKKIIGNAANKNRLRQSNTQDLKETVTAQSNLNDVIELIANMHRNREPLVHCAVYFELIADSYDELKLIQTEMMTELVRSKLNVDRLLLRQKEGFLAVTPSGYDGNDFGVTVAPDSKGRNKKGLDCSHFVDWVYWTVMNNNLGNTNTSGQIKMCKKIAKQDLKAGDLAFLINKSGKTTHVGIYAGKNAKGEAVWIHENSNDSNVAMNTVSYWSGYYRLNMMEGR